MGDAPWSRHGGGIMTSTLFEARSPSHIVPLRSERRPTISRPMNILAAAALLLAIQTPQLEPAPGTRYDPAIPTLEATVGHDFGEEITSPSSVVTYMEALAAAAPERTRLIQYATSWEGRPLVILVVSGEANMSDLDGIQDGLARLADPRGLEASEADSLIASLPVVVALVHGVHGNEISSSGAAMAEAYHLLAAQGDTVVDEIMEHAIVLIDPVQNPDGRARFVFQNLMGRAAQPDDDPLSAEHDEPWPGGRVNHYLFDLNRDWFAHTQPETKGRVAALLAFNPHVVVDLHEMGGNSTYYFPPAAVPGNPHTSEAQEGLLEDFGRANGARFDERGFLYFVREVFDSFYPGYGSSWPLAHGAIGMTFEQASARALLFRRTDGDLLTYNDGVVHHFTAAISTAHTAATQRARLLQEYLSFRQSALAGRGPDGQRDYILTSEHDPALADRLARILVQNGVEVLRSITSFEYEGRSFHAGSWIVPIGQPAGLMVRNLLDRHTPMDTAFVELQIELRGDRLPDQIYDVTAWSMPLLWDVEAIGTTRSPSVESESYGPGRPVPAFLGATSLPRTDLGYMIPWNTAGAAAATRLVRSDVLVRVTQAPMSIGDRDYGVGTAFVRAVDLKADQHSLLEDVMRDTGAEFVPFASSFPGGRVTLGSNQVRQLKDPRVLLLWDRPGQSNSAGWARYVLEQRYGVRVTAMRGATLPRAVLADYDVLVLPEGNYGSVLGGDMLQRLQTWLRNGGTLVTMGASSRWASQSGIGLLETSAELRGGAPDLGDSTPPSTNTPPQQPINFLETIAPAVEAPEQTPGAILNVDLDESHWLSSGTDGRIGAMLNSTRIFTPITLDRGTNVGIYSTLTSLIASGIVWEDARAQLASKAYLIHQPVGRGQIIAFAEDPNYRAYAEGTQLLFVNAVVLGAVF